MLLFPTFWVMCRRHYSTRIRRIPSSYESCGGDGVWGRGCAPPPHPIPTTDRLESRGATSPHAGAASDSRPRRVIGGHAPIRLIRGAIQLPQRVQQHVALLG